MERDLPATSGQFSMSVAIFILLQGLVPLLWSAISEVKGRKLVYLVSLTMFTVASIVVAISKSIGLVIGFRACQAAGSSAVIAIGAATLADVFDPHERGTKMGVFYMAPLLGPSLGPILGGALTTGFNWRAIFWFLTIVAGASLLSFVLFFKDTFRRERSLTYQTVIKQRIAAGPLPAPTPSPSKEKDGAENVEVLEVAEEPGKDVEKGAAAPQAPELKLTLRDISPFRPIGLVMRRKNNSLTLLSSGLLFAFGFFVPYAAARTLSAHYGYEALKIGLVTLAYGVGSLAGSILGGRWSDRKLAKLKAENGGVSRPEMRLQSTIPGLILLPPCTVGLGWVCNERLHIAVVCVFLFLCGFMSIWTYSSTLAYIVDANNGRSSTAVACNSAFRGAFAFASIEIVVPMQDGLGDGWMYTIWAGVLVVSGVLLLLVLRMGGKWRDRGERSEESS